MWLYNMIWGIALSENIMPIVVLKVELAVGQSEIIPDPRHIIA